MMMIIKQEDEERQQLAQFLQTWLKCAIALQHQVAYGLNVEISKLCFDADHLWVGARERWSQFDCAAHEICQPRAKCSRVGGRDRRAHGEHLQPVGAHDGGVNAVLRCARHQPNGGQRSRHYCQKKSAQFLHYSKVSSTNPRPHSFLVADVIVIDPHGLAPADE